MPMARNYDDFLQEHLIGFNKYSWKIMILHYWEVRFISKKVMTLLEMQFG